jgi:hypothetical protein
MNYILVLLSLLFCLVIYNMSCEGFIADKSNTNKNVSKWIKELTLPIGNDNYKYSPKDWGNLKIMSNSVGVLGENDINSEAALNTAALWLKTCPNQQCKRNCPIALGIANNESNYNPLAQSYDGSGRGLYQYGSNQIPTSCLVPNNCNKNTFQYTGDFCKTKSSQGVTNLNDPRLSSTDTKGCSAFDPVKSTINTQLVTNYGEDFYPKGLAWMSCDGSGSKNIKIPKGSNFTNESAVNVCQNASTQLGLGQINFRKDLKCTDGSAKPCYVIKGDPCLSNQVGVEGKRVGPEAEIPYHKYH